MFLTINKNFDEKNEFKKYNKNLKMGYNFENWV
jgi:hypothetical protein